MEVVKKERKGRKRIIFDVSDEDHELIKSIATKNRMAMRTWIINAMAKAIKEESHEEIV